MLLQSAFSVLGIIVCFFLLLFVVIRILGCRIPMSLYSGLSYRPGAWFLHHTDGKQERFTQLNLRFDSGLFILLVLTQDNQQKRLVVFNDQMTNEQNRMLRLLGRIPSRDS